LMVRAQDHALGKAPRGGPFLPGQAFLLALLGSGAILGFTTAIRPIAPLAGMLITGILLLRLSGWKARLACAAMYWGAAIWIAYLTWPFLWHDPLSRFVAANRLMSSFPWYGNELFQGSGFTVPELPWYYAGFHVVTRLTLPALTLGVAGGIIGLVRPRSLSSLAEWAMLWGWIGIPLTYVIIADSPLYDTARQILFCATPIFVMSSRAICGLLCRSKPFLGRGLLVLAIVAPGVVAIVKLHPYQYIYYNELVGGVEGAEGRYELDYWATSYREAMGYLGAHAPVGARVGVPFSIETAEPYARPDLRLVGGDGPEAIGSADFVLVPVRGVIAQQVFPDAPVYYSVVRGGAVLAVVRDLRQVH
jgi:hypothetical protein